MNEKFQIEKTQPLPEELRDFLPVNYFLLSASDENTASPPIHVASNFHQTEKRPISTFYKAISNIL